MYSDPKAADIVFAAEWPLTAIGLDVTSKVVMVESALKRIAESAGEKGRWVDTMSRTYLEFERSIGLDGIKIHDPAALACLVDPSLFEMLSAPVCVAQEGLAEGQTIAARDWHVDRLSPWNKRPQHQIAVDVDKEGVLKLVESRLSSLS